MLWDGGCRGRGAYSRRAARASLRSRLTALLLRERMSWLASRASRARDGSVDQARAARCSWLPPRASRSSTCWDRHAADCRSIAAPVAQQRWRLASCQDWWSLWSHVHVCAKRGRCIMCDITGCSAHGCGRPGRHICRRCNSILTVRAIILTIRPGKSHCYELVKTYGG